MLIFFNQQSITDFVVAANQLLRTLAALTQYFQLLIIILHQVKVPTRYTCRAGGRGGRAHQDSHRGHELSQHLTLQQSSISKQF